MITVAGYGLAFYFLAIPLKTMPVGVVYAIWSGAGIVFITAIGWVWFRQVLDTPALLRMEGVPPEVMVTLGGATALTTLVVLAILFDWRGRWGALGRIELRSEAPGSVP